jgi:predicted ATPase
MTHGVSLRTSHPGVSALVGAWLADARLTLPRPVSLAIEVGPLPLPPADDRAVFRQGRVAIRSGPPAETVTLDWEPRLGRAVLAPQSATANVTITEQGLERSNELLRSFVLNVCILLVRRVGLHHVHGATLRDPGGRDWLLVGASGSGKSTTTALLAKQGWSVGTDDIAFLAAGDTPATVDVIAWRERLALHDDAVAATGHAGGTPLVSRRKTGWYAEDIGSAWVDRVTPAVLAFTHVSATAATAVAPIRAREAVSRLMRCSPWVALEADLADEHLALISRVATQARAFDVTLGRDLFDRPGLLLELVA